ncbi:MAG: hypothetical protein R3C26_02415 [Calditrichia bacterium]
MKMIRNEGHTSAAIVLHHCRAGQHKIRQSRKTDSRRSSFNCWFSWQRANPSGKAIVALEALIGRTTPPSIDYFGEENAGRYVRPRLSLIILH